MFLSSVYHDVTFKLLLRKASECSSAELNVRRVNCLEVSPPRRVNHDFHKGESVWILSHFRIKFIFLQTMCSLWWRWVTNNGNNAHLYTGVYCETALWGMQSGGSPQIDLEPLPACGADQSPRKAFVENQSAQVQRKTLFRFERLDTQSEIRGLWEAMSPLYWLAWESLTMCHTQQNKHTKTITRD